RAPACRPARRRRRSRSGATRSADAPPPPRRTSWSWLLSIQDAAQHRGVDVASRDDADDLAAGDATGRRRGRRERAGPLGDNACPLREQAHGGGDLVERKRERAVEDLRRVLPHL